MYLTAFIMAPLALPSMKQSQNSYFNFPFPDSQKFLLGFMESFQPEVNSLPGSKHTVATETLPVLARV